MGEIIRKSAAAEDIHADTASSFDNGVARGGDWKLEAERSLGHVVPLGKSLAEQMKVLVKTVEPLVLQVDLADEEADEVTHRIYDETFNLVGRPSNDPLLAVMYASGAGGLVGSDVEGQPTRMRLLAKMYEDRLHPKVPEARANAFATELRGSADALDQALQAVRAPKAELEQLEKAYRALARVAQVGLGRFKRRMKGLGMSEAEIHSVIPDRPRPVKKDKAA